MHPTTPKPRRTEVGVGKRLCGSSRSVECWCACHNSSEICSLMRKGQFREHFLARGECAGKFFTSWLNFPTESLYRDTSFILGSHCHHISPLLPSSAVQLCGAVRFGTAKEYARRTPKDDNLKLTNSQNGTRSRCTVVACPIPAHMWSNDIGCLNPLIGRRATPVCENPVGFMSVQMTSMASKFERLRYRDLKT